MNSNRLPPGYVPLTAHTFNDSEGRGKPDKGSSSKNGSRKPSNAKRRKKTGGGNGGGGGKRPGSRKPKMQD